MNETQVTLVGVVATEPRAVVTDDRLRITSFRLVATSRKFDRDQRDWVDGDQVWVNVSCFRSLAVNAAESVHKKDRVLVTGRLRTRTWRTSDGRGGISVDVDADALGHDLSWGTSAFTRIVRGQRLDLPGRAQADALSRVVDEDAAREFAREEVDRSPFAADLTDGSDPGLFPGLPSDLDDFPGPDPAHPVDLLGVGVNGTDPDDVGADDVRVPPVMSLGVPVTPETGSRPDFGTLDAGEGSGDGTGPAIADRGGEAASAHGHFSGTGRAWTTGPEQEDSDQEPEEESFSDRPTKVTPGDAGRAVRSAPRRSRAGHA